MLNEVSLMGRPAAEPKYKEFQRDGKESCIVQMPLAVERDYNRDGVREADFILCKAFGAEARFIKEYFHKGDLMVVHGQLRTERYKKDEEEKETISTVVHVKKAYFAKRRSEEQTRNRSMNPVQDGKAYPEGTDMEPDGANYDFPPLPEEEYDGLFPPEAEMEPSI